MKWCVLLFLSPNQEGTSWFVRPRISATAHHLFSVPVMNGFISLNGFLKSKEEYFFTHKDDQISMPIRFIGAQPHSCSYVSSMAAELRICDGLHGPPKPQVFSIWPFTEKASQSLSYPTLSSIHGNENMKRYLYDWGSVLLGRGLHDKKGRRKMACFTSIIEDHFVSSSGVCPSKKGRVWRRAMLVSLLNFLTLFPIRDPLKENPIQNLSGGHQRVPLRL